MDILQIIITSIVSLIVLFLLTRLMGNRQLSQLSMFDYVVGITIGSIAGDLAIELEKPWNLGIALIVYGLAAIFIAILTNKSIRMRRFFVGRPVVLLNDGKLYKKSFKKARLDLHEFLAMARVNGYSCINNLQTAMMETNGQISFLPKAPYRPLTPQDMNLNPSQEIIQYNLIMDGKPMDDNITRAGVSVRWLHDQIKGLGFRSFSQIFLACLDGNGVLSVYKME